MLKSIHRFRENPLLLLPLLWILLWTIPWASWLDSLPWIRAGIGILIFSVPGTVISLLLMDKRLTLAAHFTSGLALSILLVSCLGLLGRIFGLPYAFVVPFFAVSGVIALIGLFNHSRSEHLLYKPQIISMVPLLLLLFMFLFSIITNLQSRFGGDDYSYLAYLTNWQHAEPLNFQEVVFGAGELDSPRFWLAMFPMSLAFLATISDVHGLLLLGLYLEPFLVVIAILAAYNLFEDFLKEEHLVISAVFLHFTFFILLQESRQPGSVFFVRLSEDKAFAAFILAPVFFLAVRHFLESFTSRSGIFLFLIGSSLAFTHPIILAYGVLIASGFIGIVTLMERDYRKFGVGITLLMITLLPSIFLRFIDGPLTTRYAINLQSALDAYGTGETRFSYIEGTPFYGFDLERIRIQKITLQDENLLAVFFSWSYLWLLVIGFVWSLFNLKKKRIAPFIAATSLLVLLCGIPYTGWLVGYFVSAGMLWRSPWLLPMGLIGVTLFREALKLVINKVSFAHTADSISGWSILSLTSLVCILLITHFSIPKYEPTSSPLSGLNSYRNELARLAALGNYLENNIEQPSVFVAPLEVMNYLPGLSSKAKVVFFRTDAFTAHSVDMEEIGSILSQDVSIPVNQRMNILRNYRINYILSEDDALREYYAHHTKFFHVQNFDDFWIIEFRDLDS
jgi:hypothetical protein